MLVFNQQPISVTILSGFHDIMKKIEEKNETLCKILEISIAVNIQAF